LDVAVSGHQSAAAREAAAADLRPLATAAAAVAFAAELAAAELAAAAAANRNPAHSAPNDARAADRFALAELVAELVAELAARETADFSSKSARNTAGTSTAAASKNCKKSVDFSNSEDLALATKPSRDVIALAISALAAAVSIACAVRDTRAEHAAASVRAAAAVAEPELAAELEPIDAP
jgi:hypothetical protein